MIGATTENPYFEVNQALISRSNVFELHSLDKEDIKKLIVRAITDDEKGMGIYRSERSPMMHWIFSQIWQKEMQEVL